MDATNTNSVASITDTKELIMARPPWLNYDVVLVHISDSQVISVVAPPRPCERSMYMTFRDEIRSIEPEHEIVAANLFSVVICHKQHFDLRHNRAASLLCRGLSHIGGDALIVIKKSAFDAFQRSHSEELTVSADLSGEEQAS